MTQHAVDRLKLEAEMDKRFQKLVKALKSQGEDIKRLQEQNMHDIGELKKVKAENIKLQKQHQQDINKLNIRQNELEKKHNKEIKEVKSKYPVALPGNAFNSVTVFLQILALCNYILSFQILSPSQLLL